MRITIYLLLAIIAGTAFGIGAALWRFYQVPEQASLDIGLVSPEEVDPTKPRPKVEVDKLEYDFGAMDSQATGTHEFVFRNLGSAPLELKKGRTTCKCTLSDIGDGIVPPGGSGSVTLEWSGKQNVGPYTQTATIITNDPAKPVVNLRIRGEMTSKVRVVPQELVFSSITAGQPAQGDVWIFGYQKEPIEITTFEADDPDNIEVSFSPMSDDEVKGEEYATCGQRMCVTIKPGLPPGPFDTRIRVRTAVQGLEEFVVPVHGTVSSEISVLGRDWIPDKAVLKMGALESGESIRKTLLVKIGGAHPEDVQLEVAEVKPEYVIVRLGERTSSPGSRVAVTPLEIEIPEGSPPGNYLGPKRENLGRIRLKTTHASVKELEIFLRFLIRG